MQKLTPPDLDFEVIDSLARTLLERGFSEDCRVELQEIVSSTPAACDYEAARYAALAIVDSRSFDLPSERLVSLIASYYAGKRVPYAASCREEAKKVLEAAEEAERAAEDSHRERIASECRAAQVDADCKLDNLKHPAGAIANLCAARAADNREADSALLALSKASSLAYDYLNGLHEALAGGALASACADYRLYAQAKDCLDLAVFAERARCSAHIDDAATRAHFCIYSLNNASNSSRLSAYRAGLRKQASKLESCLPALRAAQAADAGKAFAEAVQE